MCKISNQIIGQKYRKLQVQVLAKKPKYAILDSSLGKDAVFPEHSLPTDVQRIVLEEAIVFYVNGRPYHLKAHQHFSFPMQTGHWIKAKENSKFLTVR